MPEWDVPLSPLGRGAYYPTAWSAGFPHTSSPQTIQQSSFMPLQPSMSIWGPQIQKSSPMSFSPPNVFQEETPLPLNYTARTQLPEHPRRLSSVPSLSPSIQFSDDGFPVSPPSSPDTSVVDSTPVSPQMQPISLAKTKLSPVQSVNSTGGAEDEEITISSFCGPLYLVRFKGGRVDVFMAPGTSYYAPGDSVMVDADRGSDLGEVLQANVSRHDAICFKQKQNKERTRALSANHITGNDHHADHSVFVPKQIIGRATSSNIRDMAAKCRDEAAAVAVCNAKVAERGLNMEIVDAEYQWDRRKLTFFYNAGNRVDFRDLVRDLFRIYKTRIWMCATTAR